MIPYDFVILRYRFAWLSIVILATGLGTVLADSVAVNPETATYDYYPSAATAADGSTWFAWHGYRDAQDTILARRIGPDHDPGRVHTVSVGGSVHGPPALVTDSDSNVSVVWAAKTDGRWRIVLRQATNEQWRPLVPLSGDQVDCIDPAVAMLADGRMLVAWSECLDAEVRVRGCLVVDGRPSAAFAISSNGPDAFRPVWISHGSEVWAVWDQYDRPNYSVHARRVFPELSAIEQVTPVGEYCLKPVAMSHPSGLYVAWLRKIDVVGGPGVISQWHTLHAARRAADGWRLIETPEGRTVAAELTHGLMAKIEPRPVATGGYLGPRTRPALLADDERVWLLWERKADHRGSTPTVTGQLVGRPLRNDVWDHPVVLGRGRLDYHLIQPPVARDGKALVLASQLPRRGRRVYESFALELNESEPFNQDAWTGWKPVDLPVAAESPRRYTIAADGKTYQLFWGDLHCHNGLTADAEGEADEMHAYARDRAGLDVVVFTNNDFYNVPLTRYEFAFGNLFARVFSAKGDAGDRRLISLPGFEWTSRVPGVAGASVADPGNWLPPYRNRSYPNHRSVIYPPAGGPLVHFTEVGNDIARLNEAVRRSGGITLSQHAAFQLSGHPVEVGLELTSGWSNYIASRPQLFHQPLNDGARLGFTANGDTHRRAPGLSGALTGIYAESLSGQAILDALRARRCFATMGAKIAVDARAGGALMGQDKLATDRRVTLTLHAVGTRPIDHAVLIRDGQQIHRVAGQDARDFTATFTDENLESGTHWYYWRISQEKTAPVLPGNLMPAHGHLAWSTPHWVVVP